MDALTILYYNKLRARNEIITKNIYVNGYISLKNCCAFLILFMPFYYYLDVVIVCMIMGECLYIYVCVHVHLPCGTL